MLPNSVWQLDRGANARGVNLETRHINIGFRFSACNKRKLFPFLDDIICP